MIGERVLARQVARERRLRRRAERSLNLLWGSKRVRAAWEMERFIEAAKNGSLQRALKEAKRG